MGEVLGRVQGVCLDVWDTMLFERDGYDAKRHRIRCANLKRAFGAFGVEVSMEQLDRVLDSMHPWFSDVWCRDEDVAHLDQIRFIVKAVSGGSNIVDGWADSLSKAYTSAFYEHPPSINPDTPSLLHWLDARGIKIGIISNTGRTPGFVLRDFLDGEGLEEFFDVMVFSDEADLRKPNPEIFHLAARGLGVDPGSIVHIGDSLRSDVWGAKNVGMMAIHFSNNYYRDRFPKPGSKSSLAPLEERWSDTDPRVVEPDATITALVDAMGALVQLGNHRKKT